MGPAPSSTPVVSYLVETPQIVGFLLEIRDSFPITNIPKRADHGHEGSLACAVLAHEEGERRQAGGLFLSEAAKILEGDAVHGSLFLCGSWLFIPGSIALKGRFFTPPLRLDAVDKSNSLTTIIGGAVQPGLLLNSRPESQSGPNAGLTEVLVPAGYVRTTYDPVFELSEDGTRFVSAHNDQATTIPEPGLPFSLVFRAEPGREDALLKIASTYEAASKRRIPPPDFGPL